MDAMETTIAIDPYDFKDYSGIKGLLNFFVPLFNGAAEGTNILYIVRFTKNLVGPTVPDVLIQYAISMQNSLFGDYPDKSDFAPSLLFTILFAVLGITHLLIFSINYSRGHYFWISFVWFFNCIMKLLGFCLRAVWSQDVTQINTGLASEVFLVIPSVIFVSFDLILAQRLFTWRHPVGGSRKLFWGVMITMYFVVMLLIVVTIMASAIPYVHFMNQEAWSAWRKVNMGTGILVNLYSLTSLILIGLSYLFPPTRKDENLYTYQPWWIESFSTFYFVQPGAAQEAEETFMKRNHNHRHAVRVIAATHHHFNMVEGLTNQRGTLKHNVSLSLILVTTVLVFIGTIGRSVVLLQDRIQRFGSPAQNKVFMYICWGAFEVIINAMYIVGRVDLRFYRPDRLPRVVRNIITAEQSYFPSDDEEEEPDSGSASSFTSISEKSFSRAQHSPPYPRDDILHEKHHDDDDNLSDFHF